MEIKQRFVWKGQGYYAPVMETYEVKTHEKQTVVSMMFLGDHELYHDADRAAKMAGAGTPRYYRAEQEADLRERGIITK